MGTSTSERTSVFDIFDVPPVVNCCGIYTDLGGSVLSPTVWRAVQELNAAYVSIPDLLDSAGKLIASLIGSEAARVTPGASAAIALAVGATMTGVEGSRWEQLPDTSGLRSEALIARSHLARYKYAVCARMSGAHLIAAGPDDNFDLPSLLAAVNSKTACIFVPAHLLDGFAGVAQLEALVEGAHRLGIPVVVDAAYMVYPTELLSLFHKAGADLVCVSAKYFGGPNSGGFVAGRRELIDAVAGLDFTRFESGRYKSFGRAFKMSRYDIAATALALREWTTTNHQQRLSSYKEKVDSIATRVGSVADIQVASREFTLSEELIDSATPNCLVLTFSGAGLARAVTSRLEAGSPVVAAVLDGERVIIAVDALLDGQEALVGDRLVSALTAPGA